MEFSFTISPNESAQAVAEVTQEWTTVLDRTANRLVKPGLVTKYTALKAPVSTRFTFGLLFAGGAGFFQIITNLAGLELI